MNVEIDHKKGLPIYLQIIEQVRHQIAAGNLAVGDRLPTVRALAVSLSVNPNTVAKAYTELERSGVLQTKQGVGTFVIRSEEVVDRRERSEKLHSIATAFLDEAMWYGYSSDEVIVIIKQLIQDRAQMHKDNTAV